VVEARNHRRQVVGVGAQLRLDRRLLLLRADPLADVEAQRVADDRDASDRYDAVDHRAVVASLLRALPPGEAFVVRRYYLESFPQTAIAAELGVNQATVSRRLDRALEAMRRRSAEQTARDASALTSGT
jgi:RNA polymerase sigma factor (sigma-70 family)